MRMRTIWRTLTAAAVAVAFTGAAHAQFKLEGDPKIAMIYFDVKNDGGWTQAIDEARQRLEGQLGIEIPFTEKVPEVASQIRPAAERYIQRGFNVIIGSAFGYSDTFLELSKEYPKVAFLNPAGTTNGPNLQSYYGRTYESQHLCGMVAGAMSKSGKLGFIAAHPIGLVNWTVNAYLLGARRHQPGGHAERGLHGLLARSGQGARGGAGPDGAGRRRHRHPCRYAGGAGRGAGEGRVRHRPPPRHVGVRGRRGRLLVGLGVGQVPQPAADPDLVRRGVDDPALRRVSGHRPRRHRHRLLRADGPRTTSRTR